MMAPEGNRMLGAGPVERRWGGGVGALGCAESRADTGGSLGNAAIETPAVNANRFGGLPMRSSTDCRIEYTSMGRGNKRVSRSMPVPASPSVSPARSPPRISTSTCWPQTPLRIRLMTSRNLGGLPSQTTKFGR